MGTGRRIAVVLAVVASLGGLGAPAVQSAARGPLLEGIPRYDHIVVLLLENESAATTFGPGSPATYLNGLRQQGVFLPNYYGTAHLSLTNYIAVVSGQPPNPLTITDCLAVSLYVCAQSTTAFSNGRHLGDQLDDAGLSWKGYMDGAPTPCFHGPYSTDPADLLTPDPYQGDSQTPPAKDYADRHNPFIYFPNVVGNSERCAAHERPFTELSGDIAADRLPAFSFVTPDTCHDGHDDVCSDGSVGGLAGADQWLSTHLPPLIDYLESHNGLLVVSFDEDGIAPTGDVPAANDYVCLSCASLGLGGRTGAVLVGAGLTPGKVVTQEYDHYSLLRTIENSFGIKEHLNLAGLSQSMYEAFCP